MMKKSTKKHSIEPGQFYVDEKKGTVVYMQSSKGELIRGVSRCGKGDVFDEEKGKRIALLRCDLQIRKRDSENLRVARTAIQKIMDLSLMTRGEAGTDKIYSLSIQKASEMLNANYRAIKEIEKELREIAQ